jgi:transposase
LLHPISLFEMDMLTQPATAPQAPKPENSPSESRTIRIGVGIDTSRYGHYVAFLNEDFQPAASELAFAESPQGYRQFRQKLDQLISKHGFVHFVVRLDVAGQYADNLVSFLFQLTTGDRPLSLTLSCGDPQRNKNYRAALFGAQKSDPVEARAMARFALTEKPTPMVRLSAEMRQLRQVAGRLQATVRQRTRCINQLHQLLTLTFPELALLTKDISAGWVLAMLQSYPTAPELAKASAENLSGIPYLPEGQIPLLLQQARHSIASMNGDAMSELVRDQVRQLRDVQARQKRQESLLVSVYQSLPEANQIDSIKGIGDVTAAILTAFIVDIKRFTEPGKLVAYFGVVPHEVSSGVDRDGKRREARRYVMSKRGNDLVRRYLWMSALSAVTWNPKVRELYLRVVAKNPERKAIAIGHAMRKLLHLVFAVWRSGKRFDPNHGKKTIDPPIDAQVNPDSSMEIKNPVAGLNPETKPEQAEVTATGQDTIEDRSEPVEPNWVDFAHVKKQLTIELVFAHLGLATRLRGSGPQRRCACPLHRGDGRGRTLSVHLEKNVFKCFDAKCGKEGDVIDFWAALQQQSPRDAALDLVRTFGLEPFPRTGTEKRNG